MVRKIGILNAYDHRNRGDRAIIEAQMAWLRRKLPDAGFVVFSPAWGENASVFGTAGSQPPPIRTRSEWGRLRNGLLPLARTFSAAVGRTSSSVPSFDGCDAYVLCGGGYLYSSTAPLLSRQLWMHAGNAMLALASGKPVMQFPQSWGPVGKAADRWICGRLAERLGCVCSRGRASTELLNSWGFADKVLEVPDIVLAMRGLRPDLVSVAPEGNGWLGIAPIDYGFARRRSDGQLAIYLDRVTSVAERFAKKTGGGVTLFPQVQIPGHDDDLPVAEALAERFDALGIPHRLIRDMMWEEYWQEVSRMSVFLGSRMHACIFALVSGVPTVGLAYQPKFHAVFEQLEMSGQCVDIGEFDPAKVGSILVSLAGEGAARRQLVVEATDRLVAGLLPKLDECWARSGFPEPRPE